MYEKIIFLTVVQKYFELNNGTLFLYDVFGFGWFTGNSQLLFDKELRLLKAVALCLLFTVSVWMPTMFIAIQYYYPFHEPT